ncbi:MAG: alpha-L-fucosidase [Puniceicoccaceae bacterium]
MFGFVLLCGCGKAVKEELPDHWVVLTVEEAVVQKGVYSWVFEVDSDGRFDIQLLTDRKLDNMAFSATASVADQQVSGPLKSDYLIEDGTVSQLKPSIHFHAAGEYTLSLETDAPIEMVRVVPSYRNFIGTGKYLNEWEAMHFSPEKQESLTWFREARFGMFIHWGIYSQAGGVWKGTKIEDSPYAGPKVAEWLMSTFRIPRAEYAELAKSFNPDRSFAQNIARLAKDAGMKYVVITSKHHDGFALFNSACTDFDMVDATPYKSDAIKELYDACFAEGLEFGIYYSHGNDWGHGGDGDLAIVKERNDAIGLYTHAQGKNYWDPSPNTLSEYLESKAYPQIAELLNLMPKLRLIWFDGEGNITEEQAFRFYKMIYDHNPSIIVNRRVGYAFGDYLDAGDNVVPSADEKLSKHWETCGTTNNSWGYKAHDHDWKSTREILYWFIDIASKGGNYLLNIGPDGKGHVPRESAQRLREVGDWLSINGDAVYGTTRWRILNEGQEETELGGTGHRAARGFTRRFTVEDFWFTLRPGSGQASKENKVYAISLVKAGEKVCIRSFNKAAGEIKKVRLLGSDRFIDWNQTNTCLEIYSSDWETSENGFAVEVTF